jgi:hypothetical protein
MLFRRKPGETALYIQRASYALSAPVEHVCVDHRCAHVLVAEQFLYGADVIARLQ